MEQAMDFVRFLYNNWQTIAVTAAIWLVIIIIEQIR